MGLAGDADCAGAALVITSSLPMSNHELVAQGARTCCPAVPEGRGWVTAQAQPGGAGAPAHCQEL